MDESVVGREASEEKENKEGLKKGRRQQGKNRARNQYIGCRDYERARRQEAQLQ